MDIQIGGRPNSEGIERPCYMLGFGCPKSGTNFMAAFLSKLGGAEMNLLHEHMGNQGSVGYNMCNSHWPTNPTREYGPERRWRPSYKETRFVFHLVRDPRKTIASMKKNFEDRNQMLHVWMKKHGGTWEKVWVNWNLKCEEEIKKAKAAGCHTDFTRVEDFDSFGSRVKKFFGFKNGVADSVMGVSRRKSNLPIEYLEWSDLSFETLEMAERYGYDTEGALECLHTSEGAVSV